MDYEIFTKEWLKRAERKEAVDFIDIGDKFISLWIAFNGWLKKEYVEATQDYVLKDEAIKHERLNIIFQSLKKDNHEFISNLSALGNYKILNMQYPDNELKKQEYNDSFKSLVNCLYAIRCNLFHGRKSMDEDKKDRELVTLAYQILLPLFKNLIRQ